MPGTFPRKALSSTRRGRFRKPTRKRLCGRPRVIARACPGDRPPRPGPAGPATGTGPGPAGPARAARATAAGRGAGCSWPAGFARPSGRAWKPDLPGQADVPGKPDLPGQADLTGQAARPGCPVCMTRLLPWPRPPRSPRARAASRQAASQPGTPGSRPPHPAPGPRWTWTGWPAWCRSGWPSRRCRRPRRRCCSARRRPELYDLWLRDRPGPGETDNYVHRAPYEVPERLAHSGRPRALAPWSSCWRSAATWPRWAAPGLTSAA